MHQGYQAGDPGDSGTATPAHNIVAMRSRAAVLTLFLLLAGFLVLAAGIGATAADHRPVFAVIDVHDPLDQRMYETMTAAVREPGIDAVIFQIDSPGMASGDPSALFSAIRDADRPVLAWLGPAPAVAHGGVASLLQLVDIAGAAPGTELGYLEPTVVKGSAVAPIRDDHGDPDAVRATTRRLQRDAVVVHGPIPGYVDVVSPSIGQFIVGLDGAEIVRGGRTHVLSTAETITTDQGEQTVPAVEVRFAKPGLFDRFLRLAVRPETAFFFLLAGIAVATFEFYAAGVGISAAVAAVALTLAGYGLAVLPVRWWAVGIALLGLFLYTWEFQRNQLGWRSIAGTAALVVAGLSFTDAAPQFGPRPGIVLLVVAGTALFYGVALTTITKSRFSTPTIGRETLLGRTGVAVTDLTPEGVVEVDGARWRARSQRAAGIVAGDPIAVRSVDDSLLEVDPAGDVRE